MKCVKCGATMKKTEKFCQECGEANDIVETPVEVETKTNEKPKKKKTWLVVLIILLVVGVVIALAIAAVVVVFALGIFAYNDKKTVGKPANIINKVISEKTLEYKGKGTTIKYSNKDWEQVTLEGSGSEDDRQALKSLDEDMEGYFTKIGQTYYNDDFSCDVTTFSCQSEIGTKFKNMLSKSLESKGLELLTSYPLFTELTDGVYYGSFDYGKSYTNKKGKYYVVVSEKKNIVLSFMSNVANTEDLYKFDTTVTKLLKEMDIEDMSNHINNPTISDALNKMAAWNMYKSVRSGDLGTQKTLNGSWKLLGTDKEYFVFDDTTFYYYKDYSDLENNYFYGTYVVYTGKSGASKVGIDGSKVDNMISRSNGKISEDDVKTIILTPTKYIAENGEDKSSSLKAGSTLKYVMVMVDHDSEGIEGQLLNVEKQNISYYVKTSD